MNPFTQPLLRYFSFWMIGGGALFFCLVALAVGRDFDVDAITGGILLQLLALLPFIWLLWKHLGKELCINFFFNRKHQPFHWLELAVLWLAIIIFSYGIEGLTLIAISWWSPSQAEELLEPPILISGLPWSINLLNLFLAVIIGPVMEELVFRGLILQRFTVKYGASGAIIISSILFGVLHFENLLSATLFGLIMCLLFLQTKNLAVPIVIHVANNTMAVCLNVWQHSQGDYWNIDQVFYQRWYYILALAVTPVIIYFVRKYWSIRHPGLPYVMNYKPGK